MTKKRKRRTAQEWSEIVARWRVGGESAEAFAKAEGCHPRTLAWWASRLRDSGRRTDAREGAFAPVRVVDSRKSALGAVAIRHDSGFTVTVSAETDVALLRAALTAVSAC